MAYFTADATRPAQRAVAVTPTDAAVIECTRGLWVGGAGNVSVRFVDRPAVDVLLSGVPAGTLLPLQVTCVNATNTTATLIVALY
jgi:hypothetical protein